MFSDFAGPGSVQPQQDASFCHSCGFSVRSSIYLTPLLSYLLREARPPSPPHIRHSWPRLRASKMLGHISHTSLWRHLASAGSSHSLVGEHARINKRLVELDQHQGPRWVSVCMDRPCLTLGVFQIVTCESGNRSLLCGKKMILWHAGIYGKQQCTGIFHTMMLSYKYPGVRLFVMIQDTGYGNHGNKDDSGYKSIRIQVR